MSKTIHTLIFLTVLSFSGQAQYISKFTWDSNPVTQAVAGPNATSVGISSTSAAGGVGGTNGLNAGTGSHDIDLVIPGATFMVSGLDISIDFKRKENGASFFTLGSFDVGINTGAPYAKFLLSKGGGVDTLVSLNNILTIPSDNAFHTLHYVYNNVTGIFTASIDGVVQTTYNGIAGRPLSWTGATNVTVGSGMDGSNANVPVLDNFIVQTPPVVLPLELLSFDVIAAGNENTLRWTTTHENDLRDFAVERSSDGLNYTAIGVLTAAEGYAATNEYGFTDNNPAATGFYRLKMTDLDGAFSYSPVRKVNGAATATVSVSCYPNPAIDYVNIRTNSPVAAVYAYTVTTLDGKMIRSGVIEASGSGQQTSLNLTAAAKGMLILRVQDTRSNTTETFKILKK